MLLLFFKIKNLIKQELTHWLDIRFVTNEVIRYLLVIRRIQ